MDRIQSDLFRCGLANRHLIPRSLVDSRLGHLSIKFDRVRSKNRRLFLRLPKDSRRGGSHGLGHIRRAVGQSSRNPHYSPTNDLPCPATVSSRNPERKLLLRNTGAIKRLAEYHIKFASITRLGSSGLFRSDSVI